MPGWEFIRSSRAGLRSELSHTFCRQHWGIVAEPVRGGCDRRLDLIAWRCNRNDGNTGVLYV